MLQFQGFFCVPGESSGLQKAYEISVRLIWVQPVQEDSYTCSAPKMVDGTLRHDFNVPDMYFGMKDRIQKHKIEQKNIEFTE